MNININDIMFGHPNARDRDLIQSQTYLDKIVTEVQHYTPPPNNSNATVEELKFLVTQTQNQKVEEHHLFDEGLIPYIKNLFIAAGASEEFIDQVTKDIQTDVVPLITKLKYYFNRPRPAQLAPYHGIVLIPDFSYFTNNPSYPSGHTCLTAITCEVLGNHYPEVYSEMLELTRSVERSRLCLGVHYPSDNDMSRVVAKHVINNPEFRVKYQL